MNILCIGDVVGSIGCEFLESKLPRLKHDCKADAVIVNGENSAPSNGISRQSAERLFMCGADVITTGNHVFRQKEICEYLEDTPSVLRPANYPAGTYGSGYYSLDLGRVTVGVINLMGVIFLENLKNPFECIDELLSKVHDRIIVVDFHAEATSEKQALANYLDGRISALFGTHTHVQTNDARILAGGTGYITDAGMTGPLNSVIGVKTELAIQKMKSMLPVRFETASGECMLNGVCFTIDEQTGKTTAIDTINIIG